MPHKRIWFTLTKKSATHWIGKVLYDQDCNFCKLHLQGFDLTKILLVLISWWFHDINLHIILQVLSKDDPPRKTYVYRLNFPVAARWISLAVAPFEILPDRYNAIISHMCLPTNLPKLCNTVEFFHEAFRFVKFKFFLVPVVYLFQQLRLLILFVGHLTSTVITRTILMQSSLLGHISKYFYPLRWLYPRRHWELL